MTTFSKTIVLENFTHRSPGLSKEDGKTPFREYRLDKECIPDGAQCLQGNWTITVTYTPNNCSKEQAVQNTKDEM